MSADKDTCLLDYEMFGSVSVKSIEAITAPVEVLAILPAAK